jgi:hypothetical protein
VAQGCDRAHRGSIGGGGVAGSDAGERRRRGRGGAPASAWILANVGAM